MCSAIISDHAISVPLILIGQSLHTLMPPASLIIVLATLSGRVDCFPSLLVASLVATYITGDEAVIKAARKRWLRNELDGAELLTDRTPKMERVRTRIKTPSSTPGNSAYAGNLFAGAFAAPPVPSAAGAQAAAPGGAAMC